jgi:hypothetical protein
MQQVAHPRRQDQSGAVIAFAQAGLLAILLVVRQGLTCGHLRPAGARPASY